MIYDKLPVVLLSTLAAEKSTSTNHMIAAYILSHRDEVMNMGITQLAEACYVGTGSISRFVREIGLSGFSELRTLFNQSDFSMDHQFMNGSAEQRRKDLSSYIASVVMRTASSIDQLQLEKLCEDIHEYENVYAFGMLKAENAAVSLSTDLAMMSKPVITSAAYSDQLDLLQRAGKEDLIVIFSYTGSYFSSHSFREKEKRLLLPKIWMICGKNDNIPWFVNEVLLFESDSRREGHPFSLETAAALIAQEYAFRYNK